MIKINEFAHLLNCSGVIHRGHVWSKDKNNYLYLDGNIVYLRTVSWLYDVYLTYPEEFILSDKRSKRYGVITC